MNKALLAVLLLTAFNANATKNNEGCQGNCPSTGGGPTSSESSAVGVGLGLGVGIGGDSSANVGDIKNTATGGDGGSALSVSEGGKGGEGGSGYGFGGDAKAYGGSANQGQHQGQGQAQSSRNDNTNVSGSKSIAQMASENTNKVNASSQNANNSQASGNTTVVGGDSTLVERNAPPVFLGALTPTSCGGGFNAGGSSRDGAGAFGIQWVGKECRMRMIGDRYHALGMVDTACEVYKATKGFKDAAKANPNLRDLDCTIKPAPAPVVVPSLVAPEIAHRVPRG